MYIILKQKYTKNKVCLEKVTIFTGYKMAAYLWFGLCGGSTGHKYPYWCYFKHILFWSQYSESDTPENCQQNKIF